MNEVDASKVLYGRIKNVVSVPHYHRISDNLEAVVTKFDIALVFRA